jgi:hypothetical protein
MTESILNSTKKILGIAPEYTAFDLDILTHINSVFSTLWQIGVGPVEGFRVDDETAEWAAFLGDDVRLNQVKSYVYLRVRLLFDPPTTSFAIASLSEQAQEMAWRLQVITDPNVVIQTTDPEYIPGQF